MIGSINFRRFDRSSKIDSLFYQQNNQPSDHELAAIAMNKVGFNLYYNVRNYTAETVYISGSLRTQPLQIRSLLREGIRPDHSYNNQVIITLYNTVNIISPDVRKRNVQMRKTEIRVPGNLLGQGSLFIDEIDCYLTAEAQIDATREMIARDVSQQNWDYINLPSSMIKQEPGQLYEGYKQLIEEFIERKDKISIRVGVNLEYGLVPDIVKTMHVAILDSYFIPFSDYKLVYDPSLKIDEFAIENLHITSQQVFQSTFTELAQKGSMYLDRNEIKTLFGSYYGVALFADHDRYLNYVHQRKSQERFKEEMLYVADRSGDPLLKEQIVDLERQITELSHNAGEHKELIVSLEDTVKRLRREIKDREDTLNKIRDHYDGKFSFDAISSELENDRRRLENESVKLQNDRLDIATKEEVNRLNYRTAKLKTLAEILKSGWGITTATIGAILSILALCKKYDIKISMGG